ncbi:TetR/AcrR family transcriptional regulator [Actinoplanes subtropicus]|uniref:TetR/AcrR family transcriptional regulator n=1 Tax=Actinoplanes subtropicus TaxID=543632 RepID=UPI0004C42351|nr:TetR/AcrR family transcriptional regulator [Actinoplanes subtropicus]
MAERADAARNRQAILRATEELLTRLPPEQISMERVAAAAGVGKGTVFHRFGSRAGLMRALMQERAMVLQEAVVDGPPPLGPGAPARERLLAFVDGVIEVVSRNKGLLAALDHAEAVVSAKIPDDDPPPLHAIWHRHIAGLLHEARPGLDADVTAHLILASLHSDPIQRLVVTGEGAARVAAGLRTLITGVLD